MGIFTQTAKPRNGDAIYGPGGDGPCGSVWGWCCAGLLGPEIQLLSRLIPERSGAKPFASRSHATNPDDGTVKPQIIHLRILNDKGEATDLQRPPSLSKGRKTPFAFHQLHSLPAETGEGEGRSARKSCLAPSVLGKLVRHRQQEPAVRAGHRLKRLNQLFNRFTQVHLIGNFGCRRFSLTLEEQLVRFDFQCFGKFFQSRE